ncbi:hypothetical protein PG999_014680 [Apiospora kogelbergensis]|uniref:Condensation domain-containing protein n=1 Tax=Apiospora kogelbergensis TaxID=1337665 RepID=A0AAW0Q5T7_9PEZI
MARTEETRHHPSWTQTNSNTYVQKYGFQEVLYNAICVPPGAPGLFLIGSNVTFKYIPHAASAGVKENSLAGDLVSRFRSAWLQVRLQYPELAAENLPEGKTYTSPSSPADLQTWLQDTFVMASGEKFSGCWERLVKTRQMTLYFFPEKCQLFLQGEHIIFDGRGIMNFWDQFFRALASQSPGTLQTALESWVDGSDLALLSPRSEDILDMTEKQPGRGEARALEMLAPYHTLRISRQHTSAIAAACRAQKLSVTGAWHAAMVRAIQSTQADRLQQHRQSGKVLAEPKAGTQFACFGNFDLRRYFPNPDEVSTAHSAMASNRSNSSVLGNHHCVVPFVVAAPENKTFLELARETTAYYAQDLPKADPEVWSALGPMIRQLAPDFVRTDPDKPLEETTPALSSLGVVDQFIGSRYTDSKEMEGGAWELEDVWFGNTVTGPWLECFMWSWQGRMTLNSCYNPAYYKQAELEQFHGLVVQKLLDGLAIEDQAKL